MKPDFLNDERMVWGLGIAGAIALGLMLRSNAQAGNGGNGDSGTGGWSTEGPWSTAAQNLFCNRFGSDHRLCTPEYGDWADRPASDVDTDCGFGEACYDWTRWVTGTAAGVLE